MRLVTFASGSTGNCALISMDGAHFLIDAGISLRRIRGALSGCGLTPEDLQGVLVTHEHHDHVAGLAMLTKYHSVPIYAPRACAGYLRRTIAGVDDSLHAFVPGESFILAGIHITAFPTPHDAPDSVGYRFEGGERFAFCTDCGFISAEVTGGLSGCDTVVIEANHDPDMLLAGPYPFALKRRILSDQGHLSNEACGRLAQQLYAGGTRRFVLGHLSRENNTPAQARQTVERMLHEGGCPDAQVFVAPAAEMLTLETQEAARCWE